MSVIILSMLSVYGRAPFLTYTPSEATISYSYKTSNNSYHNDYSRFDSRLGLNFDSRETEKVFPYYNNMRITDANMNRMYFLNRMSNHSKTFPDLLKKNILNNNGNNLNGNSFIAPVDDDDENNNLLIMEGMKEPIIEESTNNTSTSDESDMSDVPEKEEISMNEIIYNDYENTSENIVIEESSEPEYTTEENCNVDINENNCSSEDNSSNTYVRYTDWNGNSVEIPVHLESFDLKIYESLDIETKENIRMIALAMDKESNGTIEDDYGVGSVLVNRIGHWGFPSTIREILFAPYQYPWVDNETIQEQPTEDSLIKAYDIWINGTNIFSNNVVFQAQFTQGDGVYALIGVHYYCYKN